MKITYFSYNLQDEAVIRRVRTLRAGGAEVRLIGFRRVEKPVSEIDGVPVIDLGRTIEGRLLERAGLVLKRSLLAGQLKSYVHADALLARNLEMCTIADAAKFWTSSRAPLVYECLDIHRSLLGDGVPSRLLRALERRILRKSDALMVSSPAFISEYFARSGQPLPRVILAENKTMPTAGDDGLRRSRKPGAPWRLGWFGILRCANSFMILLDAAKRCGEKLDITLRGRPSDEVIALIDQHLPLPKMRFAGVYHQRELSEIYADVDLSWSIDYFEEGKNSKWLLPNRIYEGGYRGCPAIALAGTQTARWLQERDAGVILARPEQDLVRFLSELNDETYDRLQECTARIPVDELAWTDASCRDLVERIIGQKR